MATKSIAGLVQSTQLDINVGRTIMGEHWKAMDEYLIGNLKQPDVNVLMPSVEFCAEFMPELRDKYISLYRGYMSLVEGVQDIPDDLAFIQGALLDGLYFGYDTNDDSYALYTMNFRVLNELNINDKDMAKQCIDKNKIGQVKGYRIDVEYINSPEQFNFKAVNHRKVLDDSVVFVPYLVSIRLMKMIEGFLNSGMVIETRQEVAGSDKVRCITKNSRVLSAFCDDPVAPTMVFPTFFPLKAMFYAPVVGAPSTTAMVTNINLFSLCRIAKVKDTAGIKKLGVEKPSDPVRSLVGSSVLIAELMTMKANNSATFREFVETFPHSEIMWGSDITDVSLSKYLHSIKEKDVEKLYKMVPRVSEKIQQRSQLFKGARQMTEEELQNIRAVLKNNICRFIIRKKDCTLSSITCTNSLAILRSLYGKDYFGRYEGFNIRFDEVLEELAQGRKLDEALKDNGFSDDEVLLAKIDEITKAEVVDNKSFAEALKQSLAESSEVKTRARSQTSNIMVRTCSAYISEEGGVQDYYRYIDPEKVVNGLVLS